MATRYTITIVREEYLPDNHVEARITYEGANSSLLREAIDCAVRQAEEWGWFAGHATDAPRAPGSPAPPAQSPAAS